MAITRRLRFSMGAVMMAVVTAAAASALFAKLRAFINQPTADTDGWDLHGPVILLLALFLTSVAIGAARQHTAVQVMLQAVLAFLMALIIVHLVDYFGTQSTAAAFAFLYWFQGCFFVTVVVPILAIRGATKDGVESTQSLWRRKTLEAIIASFFTLCLVGLGFTCQAVLFQLF